MKAKTRASASPGGKRRCLADCWAQCNCEGSGAWGKRDSGDKQGQDKSTSKRTNGALREERRERGGRLPQRVIYWHHHVPCPVLGSVTSSSLILTREETKLKVNALEKPLSWDSNPDLSGSDTPALSSKQAAI